MKICITFPHPSSIRWFWNINNLLKCSLIDCGYQITNFNESDIVISIQHLPYDIKRINNKKYILLQTEQSSRPGGVEKYYSYHPDKIWGFDIDNKKEEYLCLGYHPCLEKNYNIKQDISVGFFGCLTERRRKFNSKIINKIKQISTWDYDQKIKNIHRSKINLNIHSYSETRYTEWDRICLILANKGFLLSEEFYCPLSITQFNITNYDQIVDKYLNNEKERKEISEHLYIEYKTKFDMRNILTEKLS